MSDLRTLLAPLIREIPDFPEPGVLFRDLAPAFADAAAFRAVVDALITPTPDIDVVVGVEARGFLHGAAARAPDGLTDRDSQVTRPMRVQRGAQR